MESFTSIEQYHQELKSRMHEPEGFLFSNTALEFFPIERPVDKALPMKLSAIVTKEPCTRFAMVMTQNAFVGAPIQLARERKNNKALSAIIVNNKISNVGAPQGLQTAKKLCSEAATSLNLEQDQVLSISTGIIGWSLPIEAMTAALPQLKENLGTKTGFDLANSIMTTDRFPKLRSAKVGEASILAVAKGAGMIEPNLATMLVFIVTDADLSKKQLQNILERSTASSLNCISVDSDQSTSDFCVLLSSGTKKGISARDFELSLLGVLKSLAHDIVHNGEGTRHVMKVQVGGFGKHNRGVAKAIVNSPLVKTAIYGNDPNVGRLLSSVGDYLGNLGVSIDRSQLRVYLLGEVIFDEGVFTLDKEKEKRLSDGLLASMIDCEKAYPEHDRVVEIRVEYKSNSNIEIIYGSDLGYEYVKENADYRS